MRKKLPFKNFTWDNPNLYTKDFIKNYDDDGEYGELLEVDIEYPKTLQELHIDLPFLAQRKVLNKTLKLIKSFENKERYVVHILELKQVQNHGLIIAKVHRVIKFKQKARMKLYIEKNTKLRMESKNEFDKGFYKLMERQWKM